MKIDNILSLQDFSREGPNKIDILKSENFNVVLVCFEAGQEIPPHPEPYAVFFLVLRGQGIFTNSEGSFRLEEESSIFIEKDEPRGIKSLEELVILGIQDGH